MLRNYTNGYDAFVNDFTNEEPLPKKVAKTIAYCLLFLVSLTGNVFILWAVYRDNRLRTSTKILVANMAVSDLIFAVIVISLMVISINLDGRWLIEGDFGLALCKLLPFFQEVSFAVSVYSCIFIAIDRYYAVAHPLKRGFSRSRLKYIIPGIWIFAMLVNSVDLYSMRIIEDVDIPYCRKDWSKSGLSHLDGLRIHFLTFFILVNAIPISVIAILYSLIVYKLRKHKVPGQALDSVRIRREQQNKKVLKMSVTITTLLFIGLLPFNIRWFSFLFGNYNDIPYFIRREITSVVIFIAHSTFTYNFFIYLVFNDSYRRNFKAMICKCLCVCQCLKLHSRIHQPNEMINLNALEREI